MSDFDTYGYCPACTSTYQSAHFADCERATPRVDVCAVHVCSDCACWEANRDDSGADAAWSRDTFAIGLAEYGDHARLIIGDAEAHFRVNTCDVCGALPGDQYAATVEADAR